ncbi:MAG: pyridoxal phosphate-dependent aminotransferase [Varibaculum timonense]
MHFSRRVSNPKPNAIALAVQKRRAQGKTLVNISDSNPTRHGLGKGNSPYQANPRGSLEARHALAKYLSARDSREVNPDNLYLLSSTSQGYSWLMKLLCDFGEAVLSPTPDYPLIETLADLENVQVVPYRYAWLGRKWELDPLSLITSEDFAGEQSGRTSGTVSAQVSDKRLPGRESGGSRLGRGLRGSRSLIGRGSGRSLLGRESDRDSASSPSDSVGFPVMQAFDSDSASAPNDSAGSSVARALIVINPSNPTGAYLDSCERKTLLNYCARHSLPLIADEVFYDFPLPAAPSSRARLAGCSQNLTFALDGLSKSLSAPGYKIAWLEVSGPDSLVAEAKTRLDIIADAYLPFSEILAGQLPGFLEEIPLQVALTRGRCAANLEVLEDLVAADSVSPVTVLEPQGGWNVLLRFPSHVDEDELVKQLLDEQGIYLQPGYFFDLPFNGVISLSLLLETEVFRENAAKVLRSIKALS